MKNQFLTKAASYLIIGLAVVAMLTGSCKKEDVEDDEGDGDGYKITFKVDGVAKEFADKDLPPRGYIYENFGQFLGTARASSISFRVVDTKPIVKHDYSGYVVTPTSDGNKVYGAVLSYSDGQLSYSTQSITSPKVQVKITEITATSIRGEFSGTLESLNDKPDIKISNGKFYVERQKPPT